MIALEIEEWETVRLQTVLNEEIVRVSEELIDSEEWLSDDEFWDLNDQLDWLYEFTDQIDYQVLYSDIDDVILEGLNELSKEIT